MTNNKLSIPKFNMLNEHVGYRKYSDYMSLDIVEQWFYSADYIKNNKYIIDKNQSMESVALGLESGKPYMTTVHIYNENTGARSSIKGEFLTE